MMFLRGAIGLTLVLPLQVPRVPSFPARVENVHVDVAVTRGGRPVDDLHASDFLLKDNGVPQKVEVLERSVIVVDAILALDVSSSVRGERLDALREAVRAFVDALAPSDSVTLLVFAGDLRILARPGSSRAQLLSAFGRVEGWGATILVDAAYAALLLTDPRRGRPLVVVFSDGEDRGSWLTPEQVLSTAKASDVVVHYVDVGGPQPVLEPLASATGGIGWSARASGGLRDAFIDALAEFKSRYRLRYEPTGVQRPGWHSLDVRLVGHGAKVRARPGYFVPGEQRAR